MKWGEKLFEHTFCLIMLMFAPFIWSQDGKRVRESSEEKYLFAKPIKPNDLYGIIRYNVQNIFKS